MRSSRRNSPARQSPRAPQPPPPPRHPTDLIVVGRGNLGRSLARAWRSAGHRVLLARARNGIPALVRVLRARPLATVFLTVPDGAIAGFAAGISRAGEVPPTVAFVHCSGALGLDVLAPLGGRHATGSFHPLQSFPKPRAPEAFRGSLVAIDASTEVLRSRLSRLARDLGAKPRRVDDADRAVYHAAAVLASNYLVALASEAVDLLETIGWSRREAVDG